MMSVMSCSSVRFCIHGFSNLFLQRFGRLGHTCKHLGTSNFKLGLLGTDERTHHTRIQSFLRVSSPGIIAMAATSQSNNMAEQHDAKIVFFDVETTVPLRIGQKYELLEFAAVVLDARGLSEVHSYSTLIRPKQLDNITRRSIGCNGITKEMVTDAPNFSQIADEIHVLLNGRIWAGHNIEKFDIPRVNEAFSEIDRPAPTPAGIVDTYPLLRNTFGRRAGNLKLETLANYCGYGKQEHRSLADVRMNLDVLKSCATIMFLESNYPDILNAAREIRSRVSTVKQSATVSVLNGQIRKSREDFLLDEEESCAESSPSITLLSPEHTRDQHAVFTEWGDSSSPLLESTTKSTITDETRLARLGAQLPLTDTMMDSTNTCNVYHTLITSPICAQKVGFGVSNIGPPSSSISDNDYRSSTREGGFNRPLQDDSLICASETAMSHNKIEVGKIVIEEGYDVSEALFSLSLNDLDNTKDAEASDICSAREDSVSSVVSMREPGFASTDADIERASFLLASCIPLESIEVQDKDSQFGCKKALFLKGSPLQVLECGTKIQFTVNPAYAFRDSGKPRISIWIETSQSAFEVISRCDELVKRSMAEQCLEATWLPPLRQERGTWAARISIGTEGSRFSASYTTKFYRATSNGKEEIALGHVDAVAFRNLLPPGSVVDIGFDFDVFNINNRAGIRLVAKHVTLT